MIVTARVGPNAASFADILHLYAPAGSAILDMTYGVGAFWRGIAHSQYQLTTNDLYTTADRHDDFAHIATPASAWDVVVFDLPYAGHGTSPGISLAGRYCLDTLPDKSTRGVRQLYQAGLAEAHRILKVGGIAVVKCQDDIESSRQHWLHVDVLQAPGFVAEDLFVVVRQAPPIMRHPYQYHARKNHSYFVVLRRKGGDVMG